MPDHRPHKYQAQWQAFRRRRAWIFVAIIAEFLAFLPVVALVAVVGRHLFSTNKLAFPAALMWGAVYLFTGSRLRTFPCPRCGKNFFGGIFATPRTIFGRKCANCGLLRYGEE